MHSPFIGRLQQLTAIERLINARQGGVYALNGDPGIGKSALLKQVAGQYSDKAQIFVDLNDLPPLQTAVEFLRLLAERAQGLSDTQKALAEINATYKNVADLTAPYLSMSTEAGPLIAKKLAAHDNIFSQLGRILSGRKPKNPSDPELHLLKALIQDCRQQPLIFIDAYERLQAIGEINSRYKLAHEQLLPKHESVGLQDWLEHFLPFFQQQGAIIIIAGRTTGCWQAQADTLKHFNATGIVADDDSWHNRGIALGQQGQLDAAIDAFQKQIEIKPGHGDAWFGLGIVLGLQGRLDSAVDAFRKQVAIKPDHEKAWYNLGVALGRQGQLTEEVDAYRKQLRIKPDHDNAWYNLGIALARLGQLDAAIDGYRKQLEIKPDHDNAWNNLGIALNELGQLDAAVAAFRKQLEIKPDHDNAWYNLGIALNKQDKLHAKPGADSWSFTSKSQNLRKSSANASADSG